jgi:hypothetical protein
MGMRKLKETTMTELKSRVTEESLLLHDPRQYGIGPARSSLMTAIRSIGAGARLDQYAYTQVLATAAECVMNGDGDVLSNALLCAKNPEEHARAESILAYASCRGLSMADHESLHVIFGIPLTVQPDDWPHKHASSGVALAAPDDAPEIAVPEQWLDFGLLAKTLRNAGTVPGNARLEILPHLFGLASLGKLNWFNWYRLAMILPLQPNEALAHLPEPKPVAPFRDRFAQARMVLGAISGTSREVERFITSGITHEAQYVATLVEYFQSQMSDAMGGHRGLRVIAGVPAMGLKAVANGAYLNNVAQLRGMTDLVKSDVSERLSFRAEAHGDLEGGGRIRFLTKSTSYDWRLSKSETWETLQKHWDLLLRRSPARYLRIQLGLSGG